MRTVAKGPHVLRGMNRTAVLGELRRRAAPVTVTDLVRAVGLSRPAVTRAVADLEERRLVERREDPSLRGVGRPAQRVSFAARSGAVVGLHISPNRVHAVVADLTLARLGHLVVDTDGTAEGVLGAAVHVVHEAQKEHAGLAPLWAIGVGSPGLVDRTTGAVLVAPSIPGWTSIPVADRLHEEFHCPVVVDNDVNLAALGEQAEGVVQEVDTFAYVFWDDRVGAGLFLNGNLYRGATPSAGELGFVDLAPDPDRRADHPTGQPSDGAGAFERQVRLTTIADLARSQALEVGDEELLAQLAKAGDAGPMTVLVARMDSSAAARSTVQRVVARFCSGVATLALNVDPGTIVLGGRGAPDETVVSLVAEELAMRTLRPPLVLLSQLGDQAVAVGAVHLAGTKVDTRLAQSVGDGLDR